ncbi:hypothetical protein NC651_000083 [Populus alba x Populus x berolinensis]|nr:hypothetical protein NC651_000083 [Populus alba x Populus x berolinensis]
MAFFKECKVLHYVYSSAPPDSYYHISSRYQLHLRLQLLVIMSNVLQVLHLKLQKQACMNFQEEEKNSTSTEQDTSGKQSLAASTEFEQREKEAVIPNEQKNIDDWMGGSPKDERSMRQQKDFPKRNSYRKVVLAVSTEATWMGWHLPVKQHNGACFQGEKEFESEVEVLSKVRHENLGMLLGSCSKGSDRLLVYEYVCYGSLDQHLSRTCTQASHLGEEDEDSFGSC